MNDKKRQEIFRDDSRWSNEFDNGLIRVDHWIEDPTVYRIGTHGLTDWWYSYHLYNDKFKILITTSLSDKDLLRRLIP